MKLTPANGQAVSDARRCDQVGRGFPDYNGRFAKPAARDQDFHRSVDPRQDLDQILCWREQRQVSHQLVVNYNRMKLMLKPEGLAVRLRGKMVEIYDPATAAVPDDGTNPVGRI